MAPNNSQGEPVPISQIARLTVLIVEDDANDLLFLQGAFERSGLNADVHSVGDGEEAKDYLLANKPFDDRRAHPVPHVILLDLRLPRLSGFELLEWLGTRPELRRLAAVVLTGSAAPHEIERAFALGAQSCLLKQPDFGALIPLVRSLQQYAPSS